MLTLAFPSASGGVGLGLCALGRSSIVFCFSLANISSISREAGKLPSLDTYQYIRSTPLAIFIIGYRVHVAALSICNVQYTILLSCYWHPRSTDLELSIIMQPASSVIPSCKECIDNSPVCPKFTVFLSFGNVFLLRDSLNRENCHKHWASTQDQCTFHTHTYITSDSNTGMDILLPFTPA